jgi:hypothetical protein
MKRLFLLISGLALAFGIFATPASAAPDTAARPAVVQSTTAAERVTTASSYGSDICAVLKAEFDPQGTGYYTYRYRVQIVYGPNTPQGVEQDAWVFCLWVPKVTPNFGSLCGLYIGHLYPGNQYTHWVDSPNPRYVSPTYEDATCP